MPCHSTTDGCGRVERCLTETWLRTTYFDSCQTRDAVLPAACSKPCHAMPLPCPCHAMRARCLPDSAAGCSCIRIVGLACGFSLLGRPAANIADMLRTLPLPYHAPALPFSHTVILFCCFGRQARVCISLVRECIRGAQGGLACLSKPHTSFCQPVVLETY